MVVRVAALWLPGVFVALPVVAWWARDIARIPRRVWFWTGRDRQHWRRSVAIGWLLGGWPAIVIVLVWARSAERYELLDETRENHVRRHPDGGPAAT